MALDELDRLAAARARAGHQPVARAKRIAIWPWLLCVWPLLPVAFAVLVMWLGPWAAHQFALTFFLMSPGYAIWTGLGVVASAIKVRHAAIAAIPLVLNLICFIFAGSLLWMLRRSARFS